MKKIMIIMLMLFISLYVITACGEKKPDTDEPNQPGQTDEDEDLTPTPDEEEVHEVVLYFADKELMSTYRVSKNITVAKGESVPKASLEAWIKGPEHEALSGLINPEVTVESVEEANGVVNVSFSKAILESNLGSTGELMLAEQITMIMQQFGYEQTQILVEGEIVETLTGHLYTGEPMPARKPEDFLWIEQKEMPTVVLENEAFKIYEPVPYSEVESPIIVKGLARVFEATVQYEFEDGHFILDQGFTTATEGAPGWGEFEIRIEFDTLSNKSGTIIIYEESAKDGSRLHELMIPITVK